MSTTKSLVGTKVFAVMCREWEYNDNYSEPTGPLVSALHLTRASAEEALSKLPETDDAIGDSILELELQE